MNIDERQQQLIGTFEEYDTWMSKYSHIIAIGKALPTFHESYRTDDNLILSCQASVWVYTEVKEGRLFIEADSNAAITKGLIGMIIYVLSGQSLEDIASSELYFIDKLDLKSHLNPSKTNNFLSMINGIKSIASTGKFIKSTCSL